KRRLERAQTKGTGWSMQNRQWRIDAELQDLTSDNVILAVGATPKTLNYPQLREIPLEVALDPEKLAEEPLENATVAGFGSAPSSEIGRPPLRLGEHTS